MDEISLNESESRYFNDLFMCCDVDKTDKDEIPVLKATELFRSANLNNDAIRQISVLAGILQTATQISRLQFYTCLKLIAAYQSSVPLRKETIANAILPLPRFSWKENTNSLPSTSVNLETNGLSTDCTVSNNDNVIVPPPRREWREVQSPDLNPNSQDTTNSDIQSTDSEVEHNESNSGRKNRRNRGSPEAWSTNSDSPTPTNSVAERPWTNKDPTLWQGLLGDEHRQLLGTEEESSDRHSSDDDALEGDLEMIYRITTEQMEYYHKQFKTVQPDPNGLLSGHVARVFFEKSRIPVEELRRIWQLCDVTRDGALCLGEFTAAMHLVVLRRNNIPLPQILPLCLDPITLTGSGLPPPLNEPPEADLLHLNDDDDENSIKVDSMKEIKRVVPTRPDKNVMNLSAISTSSQLSNKIDKASTSPPPIKPRTTASNTPPAEPTTPQLRKKELVKDWTNQSKEWTKFTESPTSNVSSPGPKPANFDMQRTAQAVVSDPQILHPVPVRVTPVGADAIDDENRISRKSEQLIYEVTLRETESPKQHRDSLQNNDLRAIQRPQAKKLPSKTVGVIPPPPQREPSVGINNNGTNDPPAPPPRPHRHTRSSSLDLNKLKMTAGQPEIHQQTSFDVHTEGGGFADFTQFPDSNEQSIIANQIATTLMGNNESYQQSGSSSIPPPPRPNLSSLQTSQRVSAFEVYRKPTNTPRNSQSPQQEFQSLPLASSNTGEKQIASNNDTVLSAKIGIEYEKRVAAISETLRHVTLVKQNKNVIEILKHLKEQNILLMKLCNDLSEELLTVQQKKEEIRAKLDNNTGSTHASTTNSTNSGIHSNV